MDPSQAVAGIDQVANKAQQLNQRLSSSMAGSMNSIGQSLAHPIASIDSLTKGLGGVTDKVPGLMGLLGPFAAVTGGITGMGAALFGGIMQLGSMSKAAKQTGMDVTQFSGLMSLAGDHAEEVVNVLQHVNRTIGELQMKPEGRYELLNLGLDPTNLKTGGDALEQFYQKWQKAEGPLQKAATLHGLGGRAGQEIGGIFAEAEKMGGLEKALAAHGQGAEAMRVAAEEAKAWKEAKRSMNEYFLSWAGQSAQGAQALGRFFTTGSFDKTAKSRFEYEHEQGQGRAILDSLKAGKPLLPPTPAEPKEAGMPAGDFQKILDNLDKQVDLFGQSADAAQRYEIKLHGTAEQLRQFDEHAGKLAGLKRFKESMEEMTAVLNEVRSPIIKLEDEIANLNELGLGDKAYYTKLGQLGQSLGSIQSGTAPSNAAAEVGSREANRFLYETSMRQTNVQEQMRALLASIDAKQNVLPEIGKALEAALKDRDKGKTATVSIP